MGNAEFKNSPREHRGRRNVRKPMKNPLLPGVGAVREPPLEWNPSRFLNPQHLRKPIWGFVPKVSVSSIFRSYP
jgi:hypothetical protein